MKDLLKNFLTYGIGNVLRSALSFLLLPLYLRYFAPQEYGVIATLAVIISLLTLIISSGAMNGLLRLYYESEGHQRKILVGNTVIWYLVVATLGGLFLLAAAPLLSQALFKSSEYIMTIRLLGPLLFFSMLLSIPLYILRLEKKSLHFVSISLLCFFIDFFLKLYLIVFLHRGINGYFEAAVIANGITLFIGAILIKTQVSFSVDMTILRQLLRLGSPYIVSGFSMWTLEVSDRLLLVRFSGEEAVGIYSLAYNFANLFGVILATPIALLIDPFFFSKAASRSDNENKSLLNRMLVYYVLIGGISYLAIALGGPDLLRILSHYFGAKETYLNAIYLIPIVTLGPFIYFLASQAGYAGLLIKKPEVISAACAVAAVLNFSLNLFIIPIYGAIGAACTTAISYLALLVLAYAWIERLYPTGYNWSTIIKLAVCLSLSFFVGWSISIEYAVVSLVVRTFTSILLFIILSLFFLRPLYQDDWTGLLGVLLKKKSIKL